MLHSGYLLRLLILGVVEYLNSWCRPGALLCAFFCARIRWDSRQVEHVGCIRTTFAVSEWECCSKRRVTRKWVQFQSCTMDTTMLLVLFWLPLAIAVCNSNSTIPCGFCDTVPCRNGGACFANENSAAYPSFFCLCSSGFYGPTCEISTNLSTFILSTDL